MQQWSFNFGPGGISPEQVAEMHRQREEQMRRMVDEKLCAICRNTYLINDQITMCMKSNECVDGKNGQECDHWESLI